MYQVAFIVFATSFVHSTTFKGEYVSGVATIQQFYLSINLSAVGMTCDCITEERKAKENSVRTRE